MNTVLFREELFHGGRHGGREFLPGEEGHAGAQRVAADGGEDAEPLLTEVGSALVAEEQEGGVGGVGGEDSADELVAGEFPAAGFPGEFVEVEDFFEGEVAGDAVAGSGAEAAFGELGFDEERAEAHVDFGAVDFVAMHGEIGADAELGAEAGVDVEQRADGRTAEKTGVAEEVHEEGVGGVGAVEFGAVTVVGTWHAGTGSVGLGEAGAPRGVGEDAAVGGSEEVGVGARGLLTVDDAGDGAAGLLLVVGEAGEVERAEVAAEGGGGEVSLVFLIRHRMIVGEDEANVLRGVGRR